MPPLTARQISTALKRTPPVNTQAWRTLRRGWTADLAGATPQAVVKIAEQLAGLGTWERLTAYELIASHPGGIAALNAASIKRLAQGLGDWPGVDTFGCCVAGPAWREGRLATGQIHSWVRSPDPWQRRLALVCTVALNVRARGGRGDPLNTLEICGRLIDDRDDMVVKALSWALRALVQWDAPAVRQFVTDHEERLAARVKREVGTKLRTGLKNKPRSGQTKTL